MAARKKVGTKEAALREKRKQKVAANIVKQTGADPEKAQRAAERFVSRSGRKKATTRKKAATRKAPARRKAPVARRKAPVATRKAVRAPRQKAGSTGLRQAATGRTPARRVTRVRRTR